MSAAPEFAWIPEDSKTELSHLFEYAPLGLTRCQRDGNITALNPALKKMLAGRWGVGPCLRFCDLIHPQNHDEGERLFRELFEGKRESFQLDSPTVGADTRPLRWTVWLVLGTEGNSDYALALAEVTPHHQETAQRLRQAEKLEAVGRLAGGVAHDFNNLLTGVLLYCDLLMADPDTGQRVRKYAEEIRNAGLQASGLVRQLLGVARPANSESCLISLNQIVESMRNLLVRLIGENLELQFHLDPNLGLVKMDPTQCQQILLNLVLNARDAIPVGGHVTVETINCKVQVLTETALSTPTLLPCALFRVTDNGSGMNDATRAHLFEAFFTTKAGRGTGLGLATVYDIVTSNGGLIYVESAPACGARISVLLPLVPEAAQFSQSAHAFLPEKNREPLTP